MNVDFDQHYEKMYGQRWTALKEALSVSHQIAFELTNFEKKVQDMEKHSSGQMPERLGSGLLKQYFMDPASVLVARTLPVKAANKVLDMCAAPGGKSLVLLSNLTAQAELYCNEPSPGRREALKKVIQNYVSRDSRDRVWVKGLDGAQYGLRFSAEFDAILLDAPCSGEAHLLENQKELEVWSPKRSQGLAIKQYSLLSSAWASVKSGGYILYSTCSISPLENDGVIRKLLKKKKEQVIILKPELEIEPEWTEFGFQYFPDHYGFGPIYGCLLQKQE